MKSCSRKPRPFFSFFPSQRKLEHLYLQNCDNSYPFSFLKIIHTNLNTNKPAFQSRTFDREILILKKKKEESPPSQEPLSTVFMSYDILSSMITMLSSTSTNEIHIESLKIDNRVHNQLLQLMMQQSQKQVIGMISMQILIAKEKYRYIDTFMSHFNKQTLCTIVRSTFPWMFKEGRASNLQDFYRDQYSKLVLLIKFDSVRS